MKKKPRLTYRGERSKPFIVRYYDGEGRRLTKAFAAKMDATNFMMELTGDAPESEFALNTCERIALINLKAVCKQRNLELEEMIPSLIDYIKNKPYTNLTLGQVRDMYLDECDKAKIRYGTWKYYRYKVGKLVAHFGENANLSELTTERLEAFISPSATREHDRRTYSAFFSFMLNKRLITENPIKAIIFPKVRKPRNAPKILTPEQTQRVLQELPRELIPTFVCMIFFGVRPLEMANEFGKPSLMWKHLDFQRRILEIPGETAKMGSYRKILNGPENGWIWLEKFRSPDGPICPKSYNSVRRIRRMLTVETPHDVFRHSFASYGYHYLGIEKTVEILGHESGYEVFKTHYKAIVDPADAQKYFSIMPDVRDSLPKLRNPRLGERAPGMSDEVKMNIAYLDKRDAYDMHPKE